VATYATVFAIQDTELVVVSDDVYAMQVTLVTNFWNRDTFDFRLVYVKATIGLSDSAQQIQTTFANAVIGHALTAYGWTVRPQDLVLLSVTRG
jgi:hypothetical protein